MKIEKNEKIYSWTIVDPTIVRKNNKPHILCRCVCGKEKLVEVFSLQHGKSKSCGCLANFYCKLTKENHKYKSRNDYKIDENNNVAILKDSNNNSFTIDLEDLDRVLKLTWICNPKRGNYFTANGNENSRKMGIKLKTIQLNRYIMNCYDNNLVVDHINHNVSDNRKSNLRICTNGQNSSNKDAPKTNTSGHKGVSWDNIRNNRYVAYLRFKGKRTLKSFHIDKYKSKEEAYKQACEWVEKQSLLLEKEYSFYYQK